MMIVLTINAIDAVLVDAIKLPTMFPTRKGCRRSSCD